MARTVLSPQQMTARSGQAITFQAIDNVNQMQFPSTGREVVLIEAFLSGDQTTLIVPSLRDPAGRFGDIGPVSVIGPTNRQEFGPYDPTLFGDGIGNVLLNFAGVTGNPSIAVVLIP